MKGEFLCLMVLVVCVYANKPFTYEFIDPKLKLKHDEAFKYFYSCLAGNKPCKPDAAKFKKLLPELIKTKCVKCTPQQKQILKHLITYMKKMKPELWIDSLKNYEPLELALKDFH